ncbi:MAG TPA: hypothetical protein VFK10_20780 [Burkholderiaceae bacterium]|nr:hypothetical protein [Burkholderiaceae bacterium]
MPGLGSAHLLQGPQAAAMTNEQRIRGADRRVDSAVILTGYDAAAVAEGAKQLIGDGGVEGRGARDCALPSIAAATRWLAQKSTPGRSADARGKEAVSHRATAQAARC